MLTQLLQILLPVLIPYTAATFTVICATVPCTLAYRKWSDRGFAWCMTAIVAYGAASVIACIILFSTPDPRWDQAWELFK